MTRKLDSLDKARQAIDQIKTNKLAGAAEITRLAAEVFSLCDVRSIDDPRRLVVEVCAEMLQAQPSMAPLANLVSTVYTVASAATGAGEVIKLAARAALGFSERASQAAANAADCAATLIKNGATVMTHSRSSSVLRALEIASSASRRFRVIATESRPLLEGRAVAEALARKGITATLIADAAAALKMDAVDFVLVGADKVTPKELVNKIGTRMIALAAKERCIPVYGLCDTSKFINPAGLQTLPGFKADGPRSGDELWLLSPEGVEVANYYFEPTPLHHFTKIITEDGVLNPEEAGRRAEAVVLNQALLREIELLHRG